MDGIFWHITIPFDISKYHLYIYGWVTAGKHPGLPTNISLASAKSFSASGPTRASCTATFVVFSKDLNYMMSSWGGLNSHIIHCHTLSYIVIPYTSWIKLNISGLWLAWTSFSGSYWVLKARLKVSNLRLEDVRIVTVGVLPTQLVDLQGSPPCSLGGGTVPLTTGDIKKYTHSAGIPAASRVCSCVFICFHLFMILQGIIRPTNIQKHPKTTQATQASPPFTHRRQPRSLEEWSPVDVLHDLLDRMILHLRDEKAVGGTYHNSCHSNSHGIPWIYTDHPRYTQIQDFGCPWWPDFPRSSSVRGWEVAALSHSELQMEPICSTN